MDLKTIKDIPPWEWPEDTDRLFLGILRDQKASPSDRLLAAELGGDYVVINDELAQALLDILENPREPEDLRCRAVISLGPALEEADMEGFADPDEVSISEQTFRTIQETLLSLYVDVQLAKDVRRYILEVSVRAPQDWHRDAILEAYTSSDEAWKLTAVFCMQFVRGFDEEILESLQSTNPDIHYQAVYAAGNWGVDGAWPHILALLTSKNTEKPLLLAAIEAVVTIGPEEAPEVLGQLIDSDDQDVVDAAYEAMAMLDVEWDEEDDWEDDEDERILH